MIIFSKEDRILERKHNDLIGDILAASGEKDNFEGKGKPLAKGYTKKNIYQNFQEKAKEAGFLPAWLRMQKEISSAIQDARSQEEIKEINEKIKKYNLNCPPSMQKSLISLERIDRARQIWSS